MSHPSMTFVLVPLHPDEIQKTKPASNQMCLAAPAMTTRLEQPKPPAFRNYSSLTTCGIIGIIFPAQLASVSRFGVCHASGDGNGVA